VDATAPMANTALGVAVSEGHMAVAELLLQSGADVGIKPWVV
jgi:hypothetical protein